VLLVDGFHSATQRNLLEPAAHLMKELFQVVFVSVEFEIHRPVVYAAIIVYFTPMQWKRFLPWLVPGVPALAIKTFSFFPEAVEKYYSNGFYLFISRLLRILFGWIPFSLGDIGYTLLGLYLLFRLVRFGRRSIQRRHTRAGLSASATGFVSALLWIYVVFNLFWGLNYDRPDIATRMNLAAGPYSNNQLRTLMSAICFRLNQLDSSAHAVRPELQQHELLFRKAEDAYRVYAKHDDVYFYRSGSVKPSMFGLLGNYLGFMGYYNPFTGEAQVNTTVPVFEQPFTTCHEMAHQLGCAKEEEANFAGYLSGKSSPDAAFRYSVYIDLYLYAGSELYGRDSTLFVPFRESLHPSVREDLRELKAFSRRYKNPLEPVISRMYGSYLKANRQPQGINAYDEVVGLALAYFNKFGWDAF